MKIKFGAEQKKYITVAEMPVVNQIIKDFKEDDQLEEYGKMVARLAAGANGNFEILKSSAKISKNNRVYNYFSDESGNLDIWMEFYAYDRFYGFYEIGAYISDVWQIGDPEQYDEIKSHLYILKYSREN